MTPRIEPAEIIDAHLFLVDLVDQVDPAILSRLDGGEVGGDQRVLLRQGTRIEATRRVDHVDHAVAHGIGLLEHADGLGPAAHLDLDHALAPLVHLVDELEEALRVDQGRGKGVHRRQLVLRQGSPAAEACGDRQGRDQASVPIGLHRALPVMGHTGPLVVALGYRGIGSRPEPRRRLSTPLAKGLDLVGMPGGEVDIVPAIDELEPRCRIDPKRHIEARGGDPCRRQLHPQWQRTLAQRCQQRLAIRFADPRRAGARCSPHCP